MHGWAADHKQRCYPSFGVDSPTCHLYPCNPWIRPPVASTLQSLLRSFFASAGRSTGLLFLAAQMRKELVARTARRCGVDASFNFQTGRQAVFGGLWRGRFRPCRSPYRCAVSSSPGCFSMQVREWSCAAGLLMKTRAIVSVSGWIRPPFASARASPLAASSLPPATTRVFFFRAVQLRRMLQSCAVGTSVCFEAGRQAVSLGPCDCRFRVSQLCCEI